MDRRPQLQALLEARLGSRNVYFQSPPTNAMQYPCIIYKRERIDELFANNQPYRRKHSYLVTVIDRNPDSQIPERIGALPLSSFSRSFVSENLNHDVYRLYY